METDRQTDKQVEKENPRQTLIATEPDASTKRDSNGQTETVLK